jgi:2-iminobutanoate/2-iminopropanoate deaminase
VKDAMKSVIAVLATACLGLGLPLGAEARPRRTPKAVRRSVAKQKAPAKPPAPRVEYLVGERTRPLPFSDAVRVGHMLYLSGQIGTDATFALVPGGIRAASKQTMENVKRVLERHGSSMARVVKCTVMLADMSEWGAFNEVYAGYFRKDRLPARSALGVNGLALGARVEVECWATVD